MIKARLLGLALASLLLGACASSKFTPAFQAPSVTPVKHAIEQAEKHVSAAQAATKKIEDKCPQAKAEIEALGAELESVHVQLKVSFDEGVQLQNQIDALTKQANKLGPERDKAIAAKDAAVKKYHRCKFYGAISVGLIGAALSGIAMRVAIFIPPPYNLALLGIGPLAALLFELLL